MAHSQYTGAKQQELFFSSSLDFLPGCSEKYLNSGGYVNGKVEKSSL
jgi:hypothetical protein